MRRLPWRAIRKGSSRGRPRASRIARCRQGGAITRRKPPPPAPSSLPPRAPLRRAAPYHVGFEPDVIQPAEGRRILVLAPDRLFEDVQFDPAGQLRQPLMADDLP